MIHHYIHDIHMIYIIAVSSGIVCTFDFNVETCVFCVFTLILLRKIAKQYYSNINFQFFLKQYRNALLHKVKKINGALSLIITSILQIYYVCKVFY